MVVKGRGRKMKKKLLFLAVGCLLGLNFAFPVRAANLPITGLKGEVNGVISGDLDGDGINELVVTTSLEGYVHLFKFNDQSPVASLLLGSYVTQPTLIQLGQDGEPALAVIDNLDQAVILNWDVKELKIRSVSPPYWEQIERIAVGDLNGDGSEELVACSEQSLAVLDLACGQLSWTAETRFPEKIIGLTIEEGKLIVAFPEQLSFLILQGGKLSGD
jgi:hypothetical protein